MTSDRGSAASHWRRLALVAASLALATAACSTTDGSGDSGDQSSGSPATTAADGVIALPADIAASGVLKVGTAAFGPPWASAVGNGEFEGFEADFWNALAAELGLRAEPTQVGFDALIPAVQSGRFDMAISVMSDHADREEVVTFIDYMYSQSGTVVPQGNPNNITTDPLTLCGLTGGAGRGEDYATFISGIFNDHCVKNGKPEITLKVYPSGTDCYLGLSSGRIDFMLTGYSDAEYAVAKIGATLIENPLLPKFYDGMIVSKDNPELAQALLAALQNLVDSGEYEQLLEKWKVTRILLPDPGINLATTRPLPTPSP